MELRAARLNENTLGKVVLVSGVAALLAGCSADVTRFGGGPIYTGSTANQQQILPQQPAQPSFAQIQEGGARSGQSAPVLASPLPPSSGLSVSTSTPGSTATTTPATTASAPAAIDATTTGSIGNSATAAITPGASSYKGWSAAGGTTITILTGDTIGTLSRRYNVPEDVLATVNGVSQNVTLQPGQRIVIPVYSINNAQTATVPASALPAAPTTQAMTAVPKKRPSQIAAIGNTAGAVSSSTSGTVAPAVAMPKPISRPGVASSNTTANVAPAAQSVSTTPNTAARTSPDFRWPANGRVISGFGDNLNGGTNDGINISLPQGASIVASEAGEVIYAGDGIKNFGNLVLVSHTNGYVTAYAHASEILVKRGERVTRGQEIARAGATGSVDQPQLHFEVRKGSSPVDPNPYLAGG